MIWPFRRRTPVAEVQTETPTSRLKRLIPGATVYTHNGRVIILTTPAKAEALAKRLEKLN